MAGGDVPGRGLRGWKQIAEYLRVSIRTAQNMKGSPTACAPWRWHQGASVCLAAEVDEWRLRETPSRVRYVPDLETTGAADRAAGNVVTRWQVQTLLAQWCSWLFLSRLGAGGKGYRRNFAVEGNLG